MPVKVDSSRCCSPMPFDCDLLSEFEQELVNDICLSNYDDVWGGNLMPTPPQSPQMKFDFMDFSLDNFLDDNEETDFDQKLINHDCMWSGQCSEGRCNSMYNNSSNSSKPLSTSWTRPETQFNLSTSPINTFSDISPYDISIHEPLNNFLEEEVTEQQSVEGNVYAMANDHSYESSSPVSKEESEDETMQHTESSLINKNPIKILNAGKITKIKCKKITHSNKKPFDNSSSILNSNVVPRATPVKTETSVLKPTIISVANFKNLQEQALQAQYKVSIKKKKINIIEAKSGTFNNATSRQMIQIKKVPTFASNISMPSTIISPSTSDSEDCSVSSLSGDDNANNNRKTSPPFRRREHNDSERKRRDHLRNSFNNLKDQIPKLKSAEKRPPRIMILHEATSYVNQLIETNYGLEKTLEAELEKKKRLMNILKNLKDSC